MGCEYKAGVPGCKELLAQHLANSRNLPLHSSLRTMPTPSAALLDLRHIRVMRGDNVVLDDFNLVIQSGEHMAILGPNGCGKSTLVKTITRECYPVVRDGSCLIAAERGYDCRSVEGCQWQECGFGCPKAGCDRRGNQVKSEAPSPGRARDSYSSECEV